MVGEIPIPRIWVEYFAGMACESQTYMLGEKYGREGSMDWDA